MRGPYTCLYREIWNDEKFWLRSELGQRVYFYVLSTPFGNGLGCFRAGVAAMAEDLRMPVKRFLEGFGEGFAERFGEPLFLYDEHHKVLFIPKYFSRNPPNNPNGIKSLGKAFIQVPDCDLKSQCYQTVKSFIESKGESFAESFAESFPKPPGTISPSLSLSQSCSQSVPNAKATTNALRARDRFVYTPEFESFWAAYPNRVGKGKAFEAWNKTAHVRPELPTVLAAIESQRNGHDWTKDGGAFIPHPATWLNQGRWDDVVRAPIRAESEWERRERERKERLDAWVAADPNAHPPDDYEQESEVDF